MSKAKVSRGKLLSILQRDLNEKMANRILNRIDRLGKKETDSNIVEGEVTRHILKNIQRDLSVVMKSLSGPPIQVPRLGPTPGKPKGK